MPPEQEILGKEDREMAGFTIERKTLYEEIWSLSATKVAEKYNLSYTRLLKACRENDIPIPPPGYSTKLASGKTVDRAPLPSSEADTIIIDAPGFRRHDDSKKDNKQSADQVPESPQSEDELQVSQDDDHDKVSLLRYGDRERATREELFQKVWAQPVSIVAKEYQISDNALRKRCIHLNVPLPERGYWARLRAGKTVRKPQLPELELPKLQKPKTGDRRKLYLNSPALLFMKKRDREEILTLASTLRVGGPNSQMLESIRQMEIKCKEWNNPKPQESAGGYYIPRYRGSGDPPYLADAVSPKSYSRAFHLIDALLRAFLSYEGSLEYDHSFRVNGESVSFAITEEKDSILHEITHAERLEMLEYEEARSKGRYASKPRIPKYDHPWSGRLKIIIQEQFSFEDCKAYVLEDRIGGILIAFYEASNIMRLRRLDAAEKRRREEEEWRKMEQKKQRYNAEVEKTRALINRARDYATARMIREYITALQNASGPDESDQDWLNWAAKKADWFDPAVAREDEVLGKRRHDDDPEDKKLERRW